MFTCSLLLTVLTVKFGQSDYRVREGEGGNVVQVEVRKNQNVARNLTLKVTPLTLMEVKAMGTFMQFAPLLSASCK